MVSFRQERGAGEMARLFSLYDGFCAPVAGIWPDPTFVTGAARRRRLSMTKIGCF